MPSDVTYTSQIKFYLYINSVQKIRRKIKKDIPQSIGIQSIQFNQTLILIKRCFLFVAQSYLYFLIQITLQVNALCAALEDNNVLVQRIMLDFLLAFISMQTNLVSKSELIRIIVCTLNVVLRRDMSLNRRLYQWILNINNEGLPNDQPPSESMSNEASGKSSISSSPSIIEDESMVSTYFEAYSKKYVVAALISLFQAIDNEPVIIGKIDNSQSTSKKSDKLKPFRILISLLDKPEIGSAVLEDVLMEVLRALHHECNTTNGKTNIEKEQKKQLKEELIKTANLLFNAFEPYFIWEYLEKALKNSFIINMSNLQTSADKMDKCQSGMDEAVVTSLLPECTELFTLIDFLLDVVCLVCIFQIFFTNESSTKKDSPLIGNPKSYTVPLLKINPLNLQ